MSVARKLLAIDLGAESGRGMLGFFDGERLELKEIHRFANGPVTLLDQMVWDAPALYREILQAIRKTGAEFGVDSVGVDTWGVDFALIGRDGGLLGLPRHYRDPHTDGMMELAFQTMPRDEIYRRTGIQFLRFNTLYQLLALKRFQSPFLGQAAHLLLMPDLFHYWLTGMKVNELTNASTSQMIDPRVNNWDYELLSRFDIDAKLLGSLTLPGTVLGPLRQQIATETGVVPMPVIAPATHDTASAVVAVPGSGDDWAYLSSGTWSLLGVELTEPVITDASLAANFTNETGFNGSTRFLKNIMGLWLVQSCKKSFARGGTDLSHHELTHCAEQAPPFQALIDPDDAMFIMPNDMPQAIAAFCRRARQPAPIEIGGLVRCCLESLALKYRYVLEQIASLTGKTIKILHVVGGGCQNQLLNQFTANAIQRPVLAGPVEATAMGNVMVQVKGMGLVNTLSQIRDVIRQSCQVVVYEPHDTAMWDDAYGRYRQLIAG